MNKNVTTILTATGLGAIALAGAFALTTTHAGDGCCAAPTVLAQAAGGQLEKNAATTSVKLDIEGMSCGACAASIKTALQKLDGVKKIDITVENKGGTVEFDAAKVDEKKIVDAVNKTGFKATLAGAKS